MSCRHVGGRNVYFKCTAAGGKKDKEFEESSVSEATQQ